MKKYKKITILQMILTLTFVVAFVTSNILTGRHLQLPLGLVMTGGLFTFPITYMLSDLFSEVYGYKWSRITCYLAFAANIFFVLMATLVLKLPAPSYFTKQAAYEIVLGNTARILAASMVAFIVGDFVNDKIFSKLKEKNPNSDKGFKFRAFVSSVAGEFTDGLVFMPLAFLGSMPLQVMAITMITRTGIKVVYELLLLPLTHLIVKKVNKYELEAAEVK